MKKKQQAKSTGKSGKVKFNREQLLEALFYMYDKLAMGMVDFMVLGDVGKAIYDYADKFESEKLILGIKEKHLTKFAQSTIATFLKELERTKYGYTLEHKGIPIQIRILKRKFSFLERPDKRFIFYEDFSIPNPFKDYWKVRGLVW